jgi:hypothetical protein
MTAFLAPAASIYQVKSAAAIIRAALAKVTDLTDRCDGSNPDTERHVLLARQAQSTLWSRLAG